ncbi:MAG: serine acetyltransferase [Cytophagaceae bacterium]|nr:serine acetyltransferase [Cytophagaceae bacterium]MDW8456955.1 serine O-acetyltransferase EpsC [Cytophagaceae bacterium]
MTNKEFIEALWLKHRKVEPFPPTALITRFVTKLLLLLFPEQSKTRFENTDDLKLALNILQQELSDILQPIQPLLIAPVEKISESYFEQLPHVYHLLTSDVEAIVNGDPAATSEFEVIRTYPGFYAIAMYRLAHVLHRLHVPVIPRIITEYSHSKTGIDIHPGATIGSHFFIDHGTGIVIGETAIIGKNVKLYQGVTLGALSVEKALASTKRHPTIEDNVVIYSGATILGGETIIGHDSIIGGNVWLTSSVAPHSKVYHQAQIKIFDKQ